MADKKLSTLPVVTSLDPAKLLHLVTPGVGNEVITVEQASKTLPHSVNTGFLGVSVGPDVTESGPIPLDKTVVPLYIIGGGFVNLPAGLFQGQILILVNQTGGGDIDIAIGFQTYRMYATGSALILCYVGSQWAIISAPGTMLL